MLNRSPGAISSAGTSPASSQVTRSRLDTSDPVKVGWPGLPGSVQVMVGAVAGPGANRTFDTLEQSRPGASTSQTSSPPTGALSGPPAVPAWVTSIRKVATEPPCTVTPSTFEFGPFGPLTGTSTASTPLTTRSGGGGVTVRATVSRYDCRTPAVSWMPSFIRLLRTTAPGPGAEPRTLAWTTTSNTAPGSTYRPVGESSPMAKATTVSARLLMTNGAVLSGVAWGEPVTTKPGGRKSTTWGLRVWVALLKSTRRAKHTRSPSRNRVSSTGRSALSR